MCVCVCVCLKYIRYVYDTHVPICGSPERRHTLIDIFHMYMTHTHTPHDTHTHHTHTQPREASRTRASQLRAACGAHLHMAGQHLHQRHRLLPPPPSRPVSRRQNGDRARGVHAPGPAPCVFPWLFGNLSPLLRARSRVASGTTPPAAGQYSPQP